MTGISKISRWRTTIDVTLFWYGVKYFLRNIKGPDLSEWHVRVLRDIFVLSVSGGPRAQELQSMMF